VKKQVPKKRNEAPPPKPKLGGHMKDTVQINGDIFSTGEKWAAWEDVS